MTDDPQGRRFAPALWVSLFCLYTVSGPGHSSFVDGHLIYQTARNALAHGRLDVSPPSSVRDLVRRPGRDGKWYVKYAPGLVGAHLPALLVGRELPAALQPTIDGRPAPPDRRDEFWAQLTNAWVGAAVVTIVFLTAHALGFSGRGLSLVTGILALASPLWTYARIDSTEVLQAFGFAGALFAVAKRAPARAGLFLGVAIVTKVANVIVLPWFALALAVRTTPGGSRVASLVRFSIPLGIAGACLAIWNAQRFGSPFATGYDFASEGFSHSWIDGLWTLLVSPSFGFLVFFPSAILAIPGGVLLSRIHRPVAIAAIGAIASLVAMYAGWWAVWGVHWGPRFLVPAVPLVAVLLLPVARGGRWARAALGATAIVGVGIQSITVPIGFWTHVAPVWQYVSVDDDREILSDPRLAPLRLGAWWLHATTAARVSGDERSLEILSQSPGGPSHPWVDGDRAVGDLRALRGLDLWAAPKAWRLQALYVPGDRPWPGTPEAPWLAWLLVGTAVAVFSFGVLRR